MVEDNVHWYLMVVDIDDYAIYKLDTCRNSATWVIQWLEMEDSFMSTVIGELHDETVRMKTAMKLVMHDMNKMKKEVKTQSTLMWSKLPFI
ncbi:hypothetical protein Lal_00034882 [Lupinus albus]|nr:hypothetical protein Lal_00034882 [Lupinus albus]